MKIPVFLTLFILSSLSLFSQNDIISIVKKGIELHDSGKYKEAIKKYEEAAKIDPKNTIVNYEMANTYIALEDYKNAIKFADKVIDVKGKNLDEAFMLKATALDMSGKPKEAIKVYKKGIEVNPKSYLLYFNLGVTLSQQKEFKEAETYYLEAIKLNPSHASSHLQLGNVGMALDIKSKALLGYYFYLFLDPKAKFSELAYSQIQKILPSDTDKIKDKEKPNTFNISMPSAGDIEFTSLDLLLSIIPITEAMAKDSLKLKIDGAVNAKDSAAALAALGKVVPSNPFHAFAKRNESFFKTIGEMSEKKDSKQSYWWRFYARFFDELDKEGFTEVFSFYISLPSKDKYVKDWLEEHSDKLKEFSDWVSKYRFPD